MKTRLSRAHSSFQQGSLLFLPPKYSCISGRIYLSLGLSGPSRPSAMLLLLHVIARLPLAMSYPISLDVFQGSLVPPFWPQHGLSAFLFSPTFLGLCNVCIDDPSGALILQLKDFHKATHLHFWSLQTLTDIPQPALLLGTTPLTWGII